MNTSGNTNKYIRKIDYREPTADYKIANLVEEGSTCLEIGTSSGYMTEFLTKEKNCKVTGVEYDKELFNKAKKFFVEGLNADLNKIDSWEEKLKDSSFDYIICQDVLEHLMDPIHVLSLLKKKLKTKGKILVSIPNVSHNAIIMEILKDEFTYDKTGSLDSTHFKFFTAKSFKESCNKVGLKMLHHDITYLVPEDSSLKRSYLDYSLKEREVLFDHYNGHVFQNIFAFGKEEDYLEEKECPLNQSKLPHYDEIIIEADGERQKYYYHDGEELSYTLEKDCNCIKIYPSIRLKMYEIRCFVNENEKVLNTIENGANISNTDETKHISTGTEIYTLKDGYKKGDKVTIKITNSKSILEDKITGKIDCCNELTKLKAKIDDYKVVSIAALDCLLLLNVLKREHLIDILGDVVERKYAITNFSYIRKNTNGENVQEIYKKIEDKIGKVSNKILKEELELVENFAMLNPFMEQILIYCRDKKKKVIVVNNDLYSNDTIKNILCKYNMSYEVLSYKELAEYTKQRLLHIGADMQKDILNKYVRYLEKYHYRKVVDRAEKEYLKVKSYKESIVRAIQLNYIENGLVHKYFERFGALLVAPIYYKFTRWLFEKTREKDNVFFLARDGYMPCKVYDLLKKKYNVNNVTKYLLASRKAYQIPGLLKVSDDKILKTFTEFNLQLNEKLTLADAINNAGLDVNTVDNKVLKNNGFNDVNEVITVQNASKARNVIQNLLPQIKEELNKKLTLAEEYLKQEGIYDFDTVNVVDIGWRGSVQNYMSKITGKDIYGYYFGTLVTEYKEIANKMEGCFTNKYLPILRSEYILDNIMMFELIFSAPYPPVIGFKKENGKVVGMYSKVTNKNFIETVKIFQDSALAIIKEIVKLDEYVSNIDVPFAMSSYKHFIDAKKYTDIKKFYELQTNIGYGEKQKKYVLDVTPDDIILNNKIVLEEASYSFWKGAIYIQGIETEKDYLDFVRESGIKTREGKIKGSRYYRSLKVILNKKRK